MSDIRQCHVKRPFQNIERGNKDLLPASQRGVCVSDPLLKPYAFIMLAKASFTFGSPKARIFPIFRILLSSAGFFHLEGSSLVLGNLTCQGLFLLSEGMHVEPIFS